MSSYANRPDGGGRNGRDQPSDSIREAVERAAQHAQLAVSQGVASARALLDAASITVSGKPADTNSALSEFARTLDQASDLLSKEAPALRKAALTALLGAIDAEIVRWESRSQSDGDARAVLRAFLGLREFLWELGVRPTTEETEVQFVTTDEPRRADRTDSRRTNQRTSNLKTPRTARVQRVKVQG